MAIKQDSIPLIHIVVLHCNGLEDALACVMSLAALTQPNLSLIRPDRGLTDDSPVRLRSYTAPHALLLIETGRTLGCGGGDNVGARHVSEYNADVILLPNNGIRTNSDHFSQLTNADVNLFWAGIFDPLPRARAIASLNWGRG